MAQTIEELKTRPEDEKLKKNKVWTSVRLIGIETQDKAGVGKIPKLEIRSVGSDLVTVFVGKSLFSV